MFGIRFGVEHQVTQLALELLIWVCNITNAKKKSFLFCCDICQFRKASDFENFLLSH